MGNKKRFNCTISVIYRASLYLSRQHLRFSKQKNRRNDDTIAMSPKTIQGTGKRTNQKTGLEEVHVQDYSIYSLFESFMFQ